MDTTLEKINTFLQKHHILSLASSGADGLSACTLFYTYIPSHNIFVFASESKTEHIKQIANNPKVAGSIALETKIIGKIQGVQFRGECRLLEEKELAKHYYKAFPYALAMNPTLWIIEVEYFKFTDNTLWFGKKLIWQEASQ